MFLQSILLYARREKMIFIELERVLFLKEGEILKW